MQEGEFNFAFGGAINEVLIIDRLYLGFLCVLSILASIGLIGSQYSDYNKWYFANIVLCVCFVLLISSRIAIVLLIVLFFLRIFYTKRRKEYAIFFIGIVALVCIAFFLNKNLNERFFYAHTEKNNRSFIELFMEWEPRVVIWECNYNIAEEENFMLTGLGFYNTKDLLVNCYKGVIEKKNRREYFVQSRFNPHNQFFDFLLSAGIIGASLFAVLFLALFINGRKSYYKVSLIISLAAFAFIESYFHRQIGGYFFAITLILILYPRTEKLEQTQISIENEEY